MIKTQNLILRPALPQDFIHFYKLDVDPEVKKFLRGVASSEEESKAKFQRLLDYNTQFPDRGSYTVFHHNGEFVGFGFLINIELKTENPDHEVGYRLGKNMWGKGYATEIAKALIDYGFKTLGLKDIYGTTDPLHVVSQRVLMKAGLKDFGEASYYNGCKIFKLSSNTNK